MTELEKRALLGDKQAQQECTKRKIPLSCPCCGGEVYLFAYQEEGIPSGDIGYTARIKCKDRECGVTVKRWALKKKWAIDSVLSAFNNRPMPPIRKFEGCVLHDTGE